MQASTDVQCLTLMRADVIRLIGNLQDIYPNEGQVLEKQLSKPKPEEQDPDISLANLAVMSILGEGGFGKDRLKLSDHGSDPLDPLDPRRRFHDPLGHTILIVVFI